MPHLANIKITFSNLRPYTVNKILHVHLKQFAQFGRLYCDTWNWRWKRKRSNIAFFLQEIELDSRLNEGVGIEIGKVLFLCVKYSSAMVIAAVWENHTDTRKQLKYHNHFYRCVQCFVKGQTTEPISNLHTAFISLRTLTVCVITLSKWENLAWCHLSWWLMRSDKASWDIWHILSSLKAWNNPNIHVHQQWLAKRFYKYYCRGKAEAEKIDFSLMSFTLF